MAVSNPFWKMHMEKELKFGRPKRQSTEITTQWIIIFSLISVHFQVAVAVNATASFSATTSALLTQRLLSVKLTWSSPDIMNSFITVISPISSTESSLVSSTTSSRQNIRQHVVVTGAQTNRKRTMFSLHFWHDTSQRNARSGSSYSKWHCAFWSCDVT